MLLRARASRRVHALAMPIAAHMTLAHACTHVCPCELWDVCTCGYACLWSMRMAVHSYTDTWPTTGLRFDFCASKDGPAQVITAPTHHGPTHHGPTHNGTTHHGSTHPPVVSRGSIVQGMVERHVSTCPHADLPADIFIGSCTDNYASIVNPR